MRHLKSGRILGRTSAHRKALFRNLVTALIQRERIQTTLAKAKELRSKAEKTITLGKKGGLHARRRALGILNEKSAVQKLFGPLAERFATRNGGYTRIIKIGNRLGDDAPMAIVELLDRVKEKPEPKKETAKSKVPTKAKSVTEKNEKNSKTQEEPAKKKRKASSKKVESKDKKEAKSVTEKEDKTKKKSKTKTQKTAPKKDKKPKEKEK